MFNSHWPASHRRFGWNGWLAMWLLAPGIGGIAAEGLTWSHDGGLMRESVALEIRASHANARIYFTTNGAVPTPKTSHRLERSISLDGTVVIRAAAFEGERAISESETRTFIFPDQLPNASPGGFPRSWGTNQGEPVRAYYDFKVTEANRSEIARGLQSLPSLSLVLDGDDLFGPESGIYANPLKTGSDWERAAAIEYFPITKGEAHRVNCGVRIQGGWNRRPEESPKHAFRVVFRKKYGPGKWRAPLFDGTAPLAFDELILRAGCNNSWLHWSGEERRRGEYLRDQFMRDSYRAMGHPSARGEFVHLYLNGLYWGIYNLAERPNAEFAAAHFGGKAGDYDARNADNIIEGDSQSWDQLLALVNGGVADTGRYEAVARLMDLTAFADYMILNFYGGNADWDRASNWYAAARRKPAGKFHFFVWDGERNLEDANANTLAFDDDQSPPRLFHKLRENPAFRNLFAERARLHLRGDGALAPENAAQRYHRLADLLRPAIACEAARWGAYRHDAHQYKTGPYEVYTREQHWDREVNRLIHEFFPRRPEAVLKQFEAFGLMSAR